MVFFIALFSFLGWAPARAANVSKIDLIPPLMAQPFNDPIYAKPFFKSLAAPSKIPFADKIGWNVQTASELNALAAKFPMPAPMRGQVAVEFGNFVNAKDKTPHVILMGVFKKIGGDRSPVGSFSAIIRRDRSGELESHIASVYFDRSDPRLKGVAPAALGFLKNEVYPKLGVAKETLKADHAGRYVWAKQGYQFDPNYWFKDLGGKGPAIKLPELARRNFGRFLKLHDLKPTDLSLRGKPLASLDELQTPDDFASVVHRKGKKLTLQPFVLGILQPAAAMDVGKAFMLADYRPKGGRFVLSMARTKFNDAAMPYWNGWRKP